MITHIRTISSALIFFLLYLVLTAPIAAAGKSSYKKTFEDYQVPEVILLNQNSEEVNLRELLDSDKPLILDFIYGTCTTICPVLSAGFAHFQSKLGENSESVQMLSISIDPDNDTPDIMNAYLKRYGAKPGWDILTGQRDRVIHVLQEFDAYVSNKMDHYPLIIMRAPGSDKWVRIYGLLSASDLTREYLEMLNN